jgi:hypothetical protein
LRIPSSIIPSPLTGTYGAGSAAFFGLAGYSYFSGTAQLEKQRAVILKSGSRFGMGSRKAGIVAISMGFVWMGMWRAVRS